MVDNDKFCLSWNSFEENIRTSYKELKQEKDFCDVTVACDEDFSLEAHKVVLSSCSSFFKNLLKKHQNKANQHPMLFLRGVKQADLESLINFMYLGETQVAQDNLDTFLSTAEDLKIKGLMQNQNNTEKKNNHKRPNEKEKRVTNKDIDEIKIDADDPNEIVCLENDEENNQESTEVEAFYPEEEFADCTSNDYVDNYENLDSQNNVSDPIASSESTVKIKTPLIQRFSTAWKCGICSKVISTRKRTMSHLTEVHKISKFDSVLI